MSTLRLLQQQRQPAPKATVPVELKRTAYGMRAFPAQDPGQQSLPMQHDSKPVVLYTSNQPDAQPVLVDPSQIRPARHMAWESSPVPSLAPTHGTRGALIPGAGMAASYNNYRQPQVQTQPAPNPYSEYAKWAAAQAYPQAEDQQARNERDDGRRRQERSRERRRSRSRKRDDRDRDRNRDRDRERERERERREPRQDDRRRDERKRDERRDERPPQQTQETRRPAAAATAATAGDETKRVVDPTNPCAVTKAVFVGINYTGKKQALKGCINDVKNSLATLKSLGFPAQAEKNYRILTDEERRKPTKKEFLEACDWLLKGARAGDVLWFHFSGHGTQRPTTNVINEPDGLDEAIVPLDFETGGLIVDDDLYDHLVKNIPKGVVLFAVFDCCHSGGVLDLSYVYDEVTNKWINDETFDDRPEADGVVIMLSGCQAAQTSADLPPDFGHKLGQSIGALTSSYLPLLSKGLGWGFFIQELRKGLKKAKLPQVPQMEANRDIDLLDAAFGHAFPALSRPRDKPFVPIVGENDANHRVKALKAQKRKKQRMKAMGLEDTSEQKAGTRAFSQGGARPTSMTQAFGNMRLGSSSTGPKQGWTSQQQLRTTGQGPARPPNSLSQATYAQSYTGAPVYDRPLNFTQTRPAQASRVNRW